LSIDNSYQENILINLLQKGDEQAFADIYNQYWDKLYFLAHKHLRSAQAAEEIVQDVFLALWRKRMELQIQSLSLYLAAMTRYAVYRYVAKEKREKEKGIGLSKITDSDIDGTEAIQNKQLLDLIKNLTHLLPEKCRLVFIHNKLLDQPLSEVAAHLGISQKTAEAHLTKALKIIRGKLGDVLYILFLI
jgi:RNA polymerase sigma-70 factor (ECF subfamily)